MVTEDELDQLFTHSVTWTLVSWNQKAITKNYHDTLPKLHVPLCASIGFYSDKLNESPSLALKEGDEGEIYAEIWFYQALILLL